MDDPDGPAQPLDLSEMAFGMLVMNVRELTGHVMVLSVLLRQAAEGVEVDGIEYAQTHAHLEKLFARLTTLARQFSGPSEFPPPPGDE